MMLLQKILSQMVKDINKCEELFGKIRITQ